MIFEDEYLEDLQSLIEEKTNGLIDFSELGLQDEDRKIYLQEILEESDKEILYLTEEELNELLKIEEENFLEELPEEEFLEELPEEEFLEELPEMEELGEEFSEEELIQSGHGWEQFSHLIKVKETDTIYEDLPDLEKPLIFGYDKSGNFVANTIGENGEPVKSNVINEARSITKEVIHIDDKGEQVKTMVPTAVMDTREDNLKISIKIDSYGYPEAQKIQISHDNKWIATDIDKEGNYDKTYDVKYATDSTKQGICGNEELAENYEKLEELDDNSIELDEIEPGSERNLENIKRIVADNALENYNDMSSNELNDFIREELISNLQDDDLDIDEIVKEVKEIVEDEARFPTRGEIDY